jgi:hypothetical protein
MFEKPAVLRPVKKGKRLCRKVKIGTLLEHDLKYDETGFYLSK